MESTDGNEVVIDYRQRNHPIKVVKVGKIQPKLNFTD